MAFNDIRQAIIDGLDSTYSQDLLDVIPVTAVVRTDEHTVTITLPSLSTYDIPADDEIILTMPASAMTSPTPVVATPTISIQGEGAAAPLNGTASLTITASGSLVRFLDYRQAILDGIVSAQSETDGFNALRSSIPVTAVVRTDDTTVTITLPALPTYDITATETLSLTMPASVVGSAILATPTIPITAGAVATFEDVRQDILDGLVSAQSDPNGWNVEYLNIPVTAVERIDDTTVRITLPALPAYNITATETITGTVPGNAVALGVPIVATPTLTVTAEAAALVGTATLGITAGSVLSTAITMTGAATATVMTSSGLTTAIRMTGVAVTAVTGTSVLTTAIPLVGAATGTVTASGIMEPSNLMAGTASLAVTTTSTLATAIRLAGAATLTATADAELATVIHLTGAATGTLAATSTLATAIRFTGTVTATVTASGILIPLGSQLAGAAIARITAHGALTSGTLLTGTAALTGSATSTLATAITMTGTAILRITATGAIPTFVPIPEAIVVVAADDVVVRVDGGVGFGIAA